MDIENTTTTEAQDEMRNSIVAIASDIFARFGFKKTTVDDIAQGLRKGKSSIYYYFKSKEEIFQAVVDREANQLRFKVNEILNKPLGTIDKIRGYVKTRMAAVQQMANSYAVIKDNDFSNLDLAERVRKNYDNEEMGIIKGLLKEGVDNGTFKIKDIELSSIAILTAMKGLEVPLLVSSPMVGNLETIIDDLLDILFYGIVNHK
jgi:AcrR family transcriptional regulator